MISVKNSILQSQKLSKSDLEKFLKYTINETRKIINDKTMENKCDLAQGLIGRYFDTLGLKYYASSTHRCIMPNITGHSFIVLDYEDDLYLIDPTFIQFQQQNSDDLYVRDIRVKSKSPYYYAMEDDPFFTTALVNNGYAQLTDKGAYTYGNCFYKTLTNTPKNYSFSNIPGSVYIKSFKKGDDTLQKYGEYEEIDSVNKK